MKTVSIKIRQKHLDFLRRNNIYTSPGKDDKSWLKKGMKLEFDAGSIIEPFCAFMRCKNFFSMGAHSYSVSALPQGITIGRYCSIGKNVRVMKPDHPLDRITTAGIGYTTFHIYHDYLAQYGKTMKQTALDETKPMPVIGNDVWIADDVVLKRGITIGNGAVIDAHSVVTKDVPPYAIVAGVPAVIKRYRFDKKTIDKFADIQWWDYNLADFCGLDTVNPKQFIRDFKKLLAAGELKKYELTGVNIVEELVRL